MNGFAGSLLRSCSMACRVFFFVLKFYPALFSCYLLWSIVTCFRHGWIAVDECAPGTTEQFKKRTRTDTSQPPLMSSSACVQQDVAFNTGGEHSMCVYHVCSIRYGCMNFFRLGVTWKMGVFPVSYLADIGEFNARVACMLPVFVRKASVTASLTCSQVHRQARGEMEHKFRTVSYKYRVNSRRVQQHEK